MTSIISKQDGVLYITTSAKNGIYLKAAIESAKSIRQYSPQLSIHIYADAIGLDHIESLGETIFDSFGLIDNPHYRSKVDYILKSPFERTLYLDSDTKICYDISEMFTLLERFDLALAHAHMRNSKKTSQLWQIDIPSSFPQFNGGVILFRNTAEVRSLLKSWRNSFHETDFMKDQVTLRELLWKSNLHIATLPPEYNIRYKKYLKIWEEQEVKAKILHMAEFHATNRKMRMVKKIKRLFKLLFKKR